LLLLPTYASLSSWLRVVAYIPFHVGLLLGYILRLTIPLTNPGTEQLYRKHFPNKLDKIIVGYTGGNAAQPSYNQVCSGRTGHAEAVQITFDPDVVSYESLVDFFFRMHGAFSSAGYVQLIHFRSYNS
jgi:hypothetical protein